MKAMLAKDYVGQDPTGWLMSEKLDGVRALWDGTQFVTRNGNVIHAPAEFRQGLPVIDLDGELWMGRGRFQDTVSIVRAHAKTIADWSNIKFMVFDAPGIDLAFDVRLYAAKASIGSAPHAKFVEHERCLSRKHLDSVSRALVHRGGEGVMLKRADSRYEAGVRSSAMLKVKPLDTDDALVIGHEEGKGRNRGVVGALVCAWGNITFNLGTGLTDAVRANPPKIGARVTFQHNAVTDGGVPRFPVFIGERNYE
jgi:DNA ligase 1